MVQRFEKLSTKVEKSIKQAPEKLTTTYAEIANKGNITHIDGDTIKHSVKMALKESKNEEGKGNNVIMYNCPEPILRIKMKGWKELETINKFLTEGVKIGSMKIINTYRLGKNNDTKQERPRPLRIIFEEKNTLDKWFNIQQELSISELEAFQKKVAEAKEKNKTCTDSKINYVVQGTPNKY